ncbi:MAG: phenylglyoxylate dehydrogenase [Deltaproteobacteria bacterium]|jgi:pyruvate ferredoxin oxidoreductase alpha subunit/phenylglyoxylate dehydrogenase alpha subunit|nr:phenylglyoxylate dehydrogenase [Deltaproteobacteria bacterium]
MIETATVNHTIKAVSGNTSAALGAALCRPDVIAAYPITPQSSVVEYLAGMVANGLVDSTMVQVESEHSAMSVVQGAAAAGARVFTATSAQGLALMFEPYFRMSTLRLPMVMAIACREMTSPETVWSGQQDAMSVRDAGWIQVHVENNQEILDMIIQGYRLSEDSDIYLPVNVCYDGFFLSHLTERIELPSQDSVDVFLPKYTGHTLLDPKAPLALDPLTPGNILIKYRESHLAAMQRALQKLEDIDREFAKVFDRGWGGAVEEYRCEDAELALLTIGSTTGTAREAVDMARKEGLRVGLIKVRFMRPFPAQKIARALANKKAWAVVDRSVVFGWDSGPLYMETRAAVLDTVNGSCHFSVIGGLGGADISLGDLMGVIRKIDAQKNIPGQKQTLWLEKKI